MSIASITAMAASALEYLLDQTCTVSTPGTATANAYGGEDPGTPTTQTGIPCRVDSPTGGDQKIAERLGVVINAAVSLKLGTAVGSTGSITTERSGNVYQVNFTNEDESDRTMVRCGCKRVES
jgi:subtilase family serine protease